MNFCTLHGREAPRNACQWKRSKTKKAFVFTQYFSMSRLNPEKSKEADEEMKLADKACVILIVFVVNLDVQMMFEKHHSRSIFFAYN